MLRDGARCRAPPRACRWPSYRAAFAYTLRLAWGSAKELARQAIGDPALCALSALEEIEELQPENIPARIDALHRYSRMRVYRVFSDA